MTSSFQSTAFQSSARPVDTFVQPVRVQPKTGIEELATALVTVNPALQKFIAFKTDEAIKEEKKEGIEIAFEEAKNGFKSIVKNVRNQEGNEMANTLIGGSVFADREYNKVKAQLLGDTYTNEVETLYNSKSYEITTTEGNTINVPLSYFPANSPQFQDFLKETNVLASNLTNGVDADSVLKYFYPKQEEQISKTVTDHIENYNKYNFNKLKKQSFAVITSAYGDYREGDKDIAIEKINTFINEKVLLGITQDNETNFFDALLEYTISLRDEAYTIDGIDGSKSVLEMMRGIKYGPNGTSIFETHPEFLSKMHQQTIKHIKDKDAINVIDNKNKKEEAEKGILLLVNELGVEEGELPYSTIQRIREFGTKYNVDVSWIDEKIDIYVPDRQKVLKEFSLSLTEGAYLGQPVEASKALGIILNSLGPLTKQENSIKTKIISQIESSRKGQTEGSTQDLNNLIQRLRKQINPKYNSLEKLWALEEGEENPTEFMLNLERDLSRKFETWLRYTDENNDGVFETRTRKEIFEYLNNAENEAIIKIKEWQNKDEENPLDDGDGNEEKFTFEGDPLNKNRNINKDENETKELLTNDEVTEGDITNNETNNEAINVSLPGVESRVIAELTKMGGVTKENIDKLIEQVVAEKEKMIFTNVAGKSEADRILRFLRTGQYGYGFKGEGLKIYEPIKELVDTNNFEAGTFTEGGFTTFEIESGDSLSAISNDFGIPMEAIMKANGITNANQIDIGDVLLIPEGVDYTDLNNVNFIENLDKTKIITELEHPYAPVRRKHNFQVVYNLAKKAGIKFPEVVAAQFGVESVFGSKITGTNNYFGIKADEQDIATGNFTEADTFEEIDGKKVKVRAKFKNFKSLEESIQHYKKFWNDDFKDRKGIVNVNTSEEAIIRLKENRYATDSDYVKLVKGVLSDAIRDKLF